MTLTANFEAARQIETALRRFRSFSVSPCTSAALVRSLSGSQISIPRVAEIVESDPALTVVLLELAGESGLTINRAQFSVQQILIKLSIPALREAALSIKILDDADSAPAGDISRKDLTIHALAVACCAQQIAESIYPGDQMHLAFTAGVMHDIGCFFLDEQMPKSFKKITEQAQITNTSSILLEQKYLGTDHTLIGKHLARKWKLPDEIITAIWLHHTDPAAVSKVLIDVRLIQVVQLAECIISEAAIIPPADIAHIADALSISPDRIEQIRKNSADELSRRRQLLRLDESNASQACRTAIHDMAVELAADNKKLTEENIRLAAHSAYDEFTNAIVADAGIERLPADLAACIASHWKKLFQTGRVAVVLFNCPQNKLLEIVTPESDGLHSSVPADMPDLDLVIPPELHNQFNIFDTPPPVQKLLDQTHADFDAEKTKIAPLLTEAGAVGLIAFEFHYSVDIARHIAKFASAANVASAIIAAAVESARQGYIAEKFGQLLTQPVSGNEQQVSAEVTALLAEIAAGAAHELNNPLAVISGRAQMLAQTQTDTQKAEILKQIIDRASQISEIIKDLLAFAQPVTAHRTSISVASLLNQTIKATYQKHNLSQLEIQMQGMETLGNVFIDENQMVSAISNILSNALESYPDRNGPIRISGSVQDTAETVNICIIDSGCGMDQSVLQKATLPFFSAKQAGRQRGMGLTLAKKLIEANGGRLNIISRPGYGTTVTILLPCKT
ncbi:MAG: HDOD domain-containing protein [Planctomycetota bacterium]